ncbi:hypothetical protein AWV79_03185 [Cupriavidus sp. UYMMa02A]|nr:hypothetical protein AWV79_03185 [Cupriavidus sp. UYMMa02A]
MLFRTFRNDRGHVLAESLCALTVVSIGLIPLASLGTTGLAWLRSHEQVGQAMRAATEFVEVSAMQAVPMNRSVAVSAEGCPAPAGAGHSVCPRAGGLAIATLPTGAPGASAAGLRGIALWLQP